MPGMEAAWRILEYPIHERDPLVKLLAVHLENSQHVYFTEDSVLDRASGYPPKPHSLSSFRCVG